MAKKSEDKLKFEIEVPASEVSVTGVDIEEAKLKNGKDKDKKSSSDSNAKPRDENSSLVASYKPEDLVKAITQPPEPEDKRPPNVHQRRTMAIGYLIIFLGLFAGGIFGLYVGLGVALAGGLVIASSVMVRI